MAAQEEKLQELVPEVNTQDQVPAKFLDMLSVCFETLKTARKSLELQSKRRQRIAELKDEIKKFEEMLECKNELSEAVIKERIAELLICPISSVSMKDPVIAANGRTYERNSICQHFKAGHTAFPNGTEITDKSLFSNLFLKNFIVTFNKDVNLTEFKKDNECECSVGMTIMLEPCVLASGRCYDERNLKRFQTTQRSSTLLDPVGGAETRMRSCDTIKHIIMLLHLDKYNEEWLKLLKEELEALNCEEKYEEESDWHFSDFKRTPLNAIFIKYSLDKLREKTKNSLSNNKNRARIVSKEPFYVSLLFVLAGLAGLIFTPKFLMIINSDSTWPISLTAFFCLTFICLAVYHVRDCLTTASAQDRYIKNTKFDSILAINDDHEQFPEKESISLEALAELHNTGYLSVTTRRKIQEHFSNADINWTALEIYQDKINLLPSCNWFYNSWRSATRSEERSRSLEAGSQSIKFKFL